MPKDQSPAPPGAMVEVGFEILDEGRFLPTVNRKLREAAEALAKYELETGDKTSRSAVAIKITFARVKGAAALMGITTTIATSIPTPKGGSVAMERGGKLLCQPVGTNEEPQQQLFYDGNGRIIGPVREEIDAATGEVVEVAGRIRRAGNG